MDFRGDVRPQKSQVDRSEAVSTAITDATSGYGKR